MEKVEPVINKLLMTRNIKSQGHLGSPVDNYMTPFSETFIFPGSLTKYLNSSRIPLDSFWNWAAVHKALLVIRYYIFLLKQICKLVFIKKHERAFVF